MVGLGVLATLPRLVTPGSHFVRTIILARMLSPHDLGVAIALTVLLSTAELISDFGLDRYLISRRPEDDARALAAAHALQVTRGLLLALIIWVAAPAIAGVFGEPGLGPDFRWCALILLIRDLAHLEIRQIQRDFHYTKEAAAILIARSAALFVVYPAALRFGDYRAMLASLFVDAVVYTLASHIVAKRRYSVLTRDRRIWREALAYSLPLTLNGIGLAASSQFDRALVSHWFGVATLALYALALNLAVVPASIIGGVLNLLSVSLLAQTRGDDDAGGGAHYEAVVWGHSIAALACAIAVATSLDLLTPLVFGARYTVGSWIVILIALIVLVRIARGAPTALLLATSQTRHLMLANIVSVVGLLLAFVLLPLLPQIEAMLACVLIGDAMSYTFMLVIVRRSVTARMADAEQWARWPLMLAVASIVAMQILLRDTVTVRLGVGCTSVFVVAGYATFGFRRRFVRNGVLAALTRQGG